MLYKNLLLLLSFLTTYHLNAQDYSWTVQAQSNNSGYSSEAIHIEVDDQDNIYSAIKVYDSIWIESTHLKSKGGANIFIVKYDKNGKFLDTLSFRLGACLTHHKGELFQLSLYPICK